MKFCLLLGMISVLLAGCERKSDPYKETTGAGGAGPGYDGTGTGPAGTNINEPNNPAQTNQ